MGKVTKINKSKQDIIIGQRVKNARNKKGITQKELAKLLHIKNSQEITMLENGKRSINITKLINIANILDVSTDYLLALTDFEKPQSDYRNTHELTGLSSKAIHTLQKLKQDYGGYLIDTINFLIEEEYPFPAEIGFTLSPKSTDEEFEKAEQEAFEKYENDEEKWYKSHTPIISIIDTYFKAKAENEEIHITDSSMKSIIGNDKLAKELLPKIIISSQNLIDTTYLSKIKNQLRRGKIKYLRKKNK